MIIVLEKDHSVVIDRTGKIEKVLMINDNLLEEEIIYAENGWDEIEEIM